MKKIYKLTIFTMIVGILSAFVSTPLIASAEVMKNTSKASYLMEASTHKMLSESNSNMRLSIASMTKIMTILLAIESVNSGEFSYNDMVKVSERAESQGGSQVFLDTGAEYMYENLLKTIIISSANDASVALAEYIGGSVEGFVAMMNNRALELGTKNTKFANCTGLPALEHYSSAKDMSIIFAELIDKPKYFEYSNIWLDDFVHPSGRITTITNTNKLSRFYNGCDGGKTGFTNEAGFCLTATAMRDGLRVIAVVIGNQDSKVRFNEVRNMFDDAFGKYQNKVIVDTNTKLVNSIYVIGGNQTTLNVYPSKDIAVFLDRKASKLPNIEYEYDSRVKAPIKIGDIVGSAKIYDEGRVIQEIPLIAGENIAKASVWDNINKISKNW